MTRSISELSLNTARSFKPRRGRKDRMKSNFNSNEKENKSKGDNQETTSVPKTEH